MRRHLIVQGQAQKMSARDGLADPGPGSIASGSGGGAIRSTVPKKGWTSGHCALFECGRIRVCRQYVKSWLTQHAQQEAAVYRMLFGITCVKQV